MTRSWLIATSLALKAIALPVAASAATIGVVAPTSGPYAILGSQVLAGARAAAEKTGDRLVEIEETCEPDDAASVAEVLVAAKVSAAVGFLCGETLSGALPGLAAAGVPAITLSVRSDILMEEAAREKWPLFQLSPGDDDEAERISEVILNRWKAQPVALIEDGTIYGRELASAIRRGIEGGGLTPVFVDTYRPGQEQQVALVRRLLKAGASHVFIGGDRNDAAIIARDAAAEDMSLQILGGDTMRAADRPVPLREGTMAVAVPDYAALPSASEANGALRARGVEPEGYALPAYAAVQVVSQGMSIAASAPLQEALVSARFQTAIGPVAFEKSGALAGNPLVLQEWRGGRFVPLDVSAE